MNLIVSRSGSAHPYTGYVYRHLPGATSVTSLTLPNSVTAGPLRPSIASYKGQFHIVGMFNTNLVVDSEWNVKIAGLPAPQVTPSLAASGTGITGSAIGYLTFAEVRNNVVLQESNLSAASSTVTLTNQGRSWTSLPTTCPNPRATHICGYVSMDGALPRKAWARELGTTSVTESVPTATLANLTAAPAFADGTVDVGARGVPLPASAIVIWRDRAWYIVPGKRGVYFSKLFEPESVDVDSFINTRDGEIPTGLGVLEGELVVFCSESIYTVSGWGISDFEIQKVSSDYGAVSHHSIVNIQNVLWFASKQGIATYAGGRVYNMMARSRRSAFASHYTTYTAAYEDSVGVADTNGYYRLYVDLATGNRGYAHVARYWDVTEEGAIEPSWSLDICTRAVTAAGFIGASSTQTRKLLVVGSTDGFIRHEDSTDDDDDSDTYAKKTTIQPGHLFPGDQCGNNHHGWAYPSVDVFAANPNDAIATKFYGGDDDASSAAAPQASPTIAAVSNTSFTSKTSHFVPLSGVAGKGLTRRYEVTSPTNFEYRGDAVYFTSGVQTRGPK